MKGAAYNEEHRQWAASKVVAIAKSIVSGELGIVAGARQLATWRFDLDANSDPDFMFFVGLDSETDHLPVGSERANWNPDVLKTKDEELRRYEDSFRHRAFQICHRMITKYETKSG